MNAMKLRRLLITLHLWVAGLLAPAFLVVAISGGLHIAGSVAEAVRTPVALAPGQQIDLRSDDLEAQVRALIEAQQLNVDFEYIRGGAGRAQTRPTTRRFLTMEEGPAGIEIAVNEPNFQFALMELHKGHGPRAYRMYQIAVALALFFVVVGGIAVGVLARNYRSSTLIALGAGTFVAVLLAVL